MDDFEAEDKAEIPRPLAFVVNVEGFEGPLDLLLALARDQKLDITQISILQLADQYLGFIARVRRSDLELAADYLVMAAWLAYLKSKLLLPDIGGKEEPSGEQLAAALAFQLQRLEAMQEAGARLLARPRLGRDFLPRGETGIRREEGRTIWDVTLYDLLRAYADHKRRTRTGSLEIEPFDLYTMEDALNRLRRLLGHAPDWSDLMRFLPDDLKDGLVARSALASTFAASLEMVRDGKAAIRQEGVFGPIFLRPSQGSDTREA